MLAGIFYNNLFRWFFDEKLKQEIVALLYVNQNRFVSGFLSSPRVVTIEEVDTMQNFLKDPRVVDALVINKYGQIRWSKDAQLFGKRIEEYQSIHPLPTDAIARSYVTKSPKVLPFELEGRSFYEVTVPLMSQGDMRGVVSIQVSREETKETLAQGMQRFYLGGAGVVAIFLATGVFFLYKSVAGPIKETKEIVDSLSITQPAWPSKEMRSDEIGDLHKSLSAFFDKLRAAVSRYEKDRRDVGELERARWEQILKVLVRTGGAIVLDGDNYVMASHNLAHFAVKAPQIAMRATPKILPGALGPTAEKAGGPQAAAQTTARLHLLDFITSAELLQLINKALERPGHFSEGAVLVDAQPFSARVITISAGQPQDQRTLVWLESQTKVSA